MRWGALFGDMEAQLGEAARLEREAQAAELTRGERSRSLLTDRLRSSLGRLLTVTLAPGLAPAGILTHAGNGWLILDAGAHDWLIPAPGILMLGGAAREVAPTPGKVWQGTGLAGALRVIARDRALVRVLLARGGTLPQEILGVISAVGGDHFDLVVQDPAGERGMGREALLVPFQAVLAVRGEDASGAFRRV